jgi:hypothetical protein
MTKHDLGLPSGIKDSTYQQNREKEIIRLKAENEMIRQENKKIYFRLIKGI